jgi:hypothetical protein
MKSSMKKLAVFVIIAAIAMFIAVAMVSAGDKLGEVYGEYAFTGAGGCLISLTGFNPNLSPLEPFWTNSFNLSGIWIFNRDGTGNGQATQVGITATAPSPGVSLMEYTFPFTYSIADDGTITVVGEVIGNILAGSSVIGTFTVDKWSVSGMASPDHKTMTLATVAPEIETVNLLYFPSFALTVYEICHRSDTLIRIHK